MYHLGLNDNSNICWTIYSFPNFRPYLQGISNAVLIDRDLVLKQ